MIIIDENVDQVLIERLDNANFETISIRKHYHGISDKEVIKIAKSKKGLVLTEDKDFGELVFSSNIRECSIIFLRYNKSDYDQIEKNIIMVLKEYNDNPEHVFITVTKNKIRIRKI